ncbi:MAG TPA: beta-ketoacyl synthase chain length factor [Kofleriaceae bacterium]|nr:beta-ketoacyl synthase chain length factor [Kofleriaceae bacterium]
MTATVGAVQIVQAAWFSTSHASAHDAVTARERPFTPPAYPLLMGRARRFTSLVTQMHIEVCGALRLDAADPPMAVFATRQGEIQTAERLISDFRDTAMVSSARFALSVHNTASGVYSVAAGSHAPATTVTGDNAIAAGWLEAVLSALDANRRVLLSIADEPVPAVFGGPSGTTGVAAAFLLAPIGGAPAGRRAELSIAPAPDAANDDAPDTLHVLARAVDAWTRGAAAAIALGRIQPGAALELRLAPEGAA